MKILFQILNVEIETKIEKLKKKGKRRLKILFQVRFAVWTSNTTLFLNSTMVYRAWHFFVPCLSTVTMLMAKNTDERNNMLIWYT